MRSTSVSKALALRKQTALDSGSSEVTAKTILYAGMAELADALDSGSSEVTFVQVQVLLPAPTPKGHHSMPLWWWAGNSLSLTCLQGRRHWKRTIFEFYSKKTTKYFFFFAKHLPFLQDLYYNIVIIAI